MNGRHEIWWSVVFGVIAGFVMGFLAISIEENQAGQERAALLGSEVVWALAGGAAGTVHALLKPLRYRSWWGCFTAWAVVSVVTLAPFAIADVLREPKLRTVVAWTAMMMLCALGGTKSEHQLRGG